MTTNHTFGEAITAAKAGKRISRAGWNGKGMFVFVQVPSEVPEAIVPKMSSLPPEVKAELVRRGGSIRYKNQMAIVYPDNIISGWVASVSDGLESDWCIHHEESLTLGDYKAAPVEETVGLASPLPSSYPVS